MTTISSPTAIAVLVGLPLLLPPNIAKVRLDKQKETKGSTKERYTLMGGGPPSSPSLSSPSSSGDRLRVTKHPAPELLEKPNTASVALSFQSSLAEGARGYLHLQVFPMSVHIIPRSGAHAFYPRKWWRDCRSPLLHQQHSSVSIFWAVSRR